MFEPLVNLGSRFAGAACALPKPNFLKFPTWYEYLRGELVAGRCTPVFIFPNDIGKILLAIVEIMLRIAALVAVGFVIYGGFRYILSQGEPEQQNQARSTIINALIGLLVSALATAIVSFIFHNIAQ